MIVLRGLTARNTNTTHTIYYRGHWLGVSSSDVWPSVCPDELSNKITRTKRFQDYGSYVELGGTLLHPDTLSVVARKNDILKKLVLEAKREYEKDAEHRVHIFMANTYVTRDRDISGCPNAHLTCLACRSAHTAAGVGTERARSGQ